MIDNRAKLGELLAKDDKLTGNENVYIWGTGNTTMLYQEGLSRIVNRGGQYQRIY